MPEERETPSQSGGVRISGGTANVHGDMIGGNKITQQAAPRGVSALHQLPAPPADFTGRTTELAELLEAIKKNGVIISGLQGLGGVGKTALALKLAEQLKDKYPDAQFYIDLKGVTQPLAPKEAMARVIHAYHPTAQLPDNEAEVRSVYLSVLHDKRALLVMDNARDDAQVKPLIPPQNCLVLVTSRQHFHLPGLVFKHLEQMPHDDACELLQMIAPRLREANQIEIDKLAELCGRLPLALEKVASALLVREDLSPTDYIRRLEDTRKRLQLTSTDVVLQSSYDLLLPDLQQRFRFLAVFPESFDLAAAAAVWATETDSAQDFLGVLLCYSLVDFVKVRGRYRLHDLVRVFAGHRLASEEGTMARTRHSEHYLKILSAADNLFLKGGESVTEGLALFDTEWVNIENGQAWAAEHAGADESGAEICWEYQDAGAYCLALRQRPSERIRWLEQALAAARGLKSRAWEANALGNLGVVYQTLGKNRLAIKCFEQVLEITRELGDRRHEGSSLGNLGVAYKNLGKYERSVEYLELRLAIAREIGDLRGEGNALGNLGTTYRGMGNYHRAAEYYEEALLIDRKTGDRANEAIDLWNSALTCDNLGNRRGAIVRAEDALKILEVIASPGAQEVRDRLLEWRMAPGDPAI